MKKYAVVERPDGEFYCRFQADEKQFCIVMDNGYRVFLDIKVLPSLKIFVDSLVGSENKILD